MELCSCVYVYVCMCVHVCLSVCVCVYVVLYSLPVFKLRKKRVYFKNAFLVGVCVCVCVCACVCACVCVCVCLGERNFVISRWCVRSEERCVGKECRSG